MSQPPNLLVKLTKLHGQTQEETFSFREESMDLFRNMYKQSNPVTPEPQWTSSGVTGLLSLYIFLKLVQQPIPMLPSMDLVM
jgi:hypothetical protein